MKLTDRMKLAKALFTNMKKEFKLQDAQQCYIWEEMSVTDR